jgi:hypothetical protein
VHEDEPLFAQRALPRVAEAQIDPARIGAMERLDDLRVERRRRLGVAVLEEGLARHPRVPAPGLALAGEDQLHEARCKPCRNGDSGGVEGAGPAAGSASAKE